jgi:hypothetical protein
MNDDKLQEVLRLHKLWANNKEGGVEAVNLCNANLFGANMHNADLFHANLHGAMLHGADLRGANLFGSDLQGANLHGANLYGADLRHANLCRADLSSANLKRADMRHSTLQYADLQYADLQNADLQYADLYNANLMYAQIPIAVGGPAGSERRLTYYIYSCDEVQCGCFRGTLAKFAVKVEKTHKNYPRQLKEYRAMIEYFKSMREAYTEDGK